MNRRTLLKRTTALTGVALTPGIISGILSGCTPEKTLNWKPRFFTGEEAKDISAIANIIIPATETPGATETATDQFIDTIVADCFSNDEKEKISSAFVRLNELVKEKGEDRFHHLSQEDQVALVTDMDKNMKNDKEVSRLYRAVKSLTISGYLSSEAGLTGYYKYEPVPGKFEGCRTLNPNEKLWRGANV